MLEIGGVFGIVGILCIFYLVLRPVLQWVVERVRKGTKPVSVQLKKVYQVVNKTHRVVGIVGATAIVLHFVFQYLRFSFIPIPGVVAAVLLLAQAGLGFALHRQGDKDKRSKLARVHRILGLVLVVAALSHRL